MFLLAGSLSADRSTLRALCENLSAHLEIAEWIQATGVETFDGRWGDAERLADPLLVKGRLAVGMGFPPSSDATTIPHLTSASKVGKSGPGSVAIATPLHAALGLSDLTPLDPSQLQLTDAESRALCEAADALMREEGVQIEFIEASQWRVTCNRKIDVLTERPDWIIGEALRPNLPRGRDARLVERWMNELQMLFFSHPVNAARAASGAPVVNMVWFWGFHDSLPHDSSTEDKHANDTRLQTRPAKAAQILEGSFDTRMLVALRNGDLPGWQRAWGELSERIVRSEAIIIGDARPRLLLRKPTGSPTVTQKIRSFFSRKSALADVLQSLQQKL
jgi:hypothetical protein